MHIASRRRHSRNSGRKRATQLVTRSRSRATEFLCVQGAAPICWLRFCCCYCYCSAALAALPGLSSRGIGCTFLISLTRVEAAMMVEEGAARVRFHNSDFIIKVMAKVKPLSLCHFDASASEAEPVAGSRALREMQVFER